MARLTALAAVTFLAHAPLASAQAWLGGFPAGAAALPPIIEFINRRPKLKILPGWDPEGKQTWFMLTFGRIREVDADGKEVAGRSIKSLADHESVAWTQESREIGGVPTNITTMTLPLRDATSFRECVGGAFGGGRRLQSSGSVAIRVYVFNETTKVAYGPEEVEVEKSQMKFNIEAADWPFCGDDHRLEVRMSVTTISAEKVEKVKKLFGLVQTLAGLLGPALTQRQQQRFAQRSHVKAKGFRQRAGAADMQLELPTIAIVDGEVADCDVDMEESGPLTTIKYSFPAFNRTLLYDPTAGSAAPAEATGDSGTANGTAGETTDTSATLADGAPGASACALGALAMASLALAA